MHPRDDCDHRSPADFRMTARDHWRNVAAMLKLDD
jgi:hypothetical protein